MSSRVQDLQKLLYLLQARRVRHVLAWSRGAVIFATRTSSFQLGQLGEGVDVGPASLRMTSESSPPFSRG